ncbi:uncharacterized protein LOC124632914 [Helicoverpa zea]|uniref:uncharacterized protein LOC124632914 n=1 Tax=Helicoverpa zea TaxID=7113 RepID=UPI001F56E402|nr:uncharacterized protein LOC124632914 [Helicoverpa zea]
MQHWCACAVWVNVSRTSPMYARVADVLADYIDSLTLQQRSKCARRKLQSIVTVLQRTVNNHLLKYGIDASVLTNPTFEPPRAPMEYYQAQIILSPAHAVFEGTLTYNTRADAFTMSTNYISRIST